MRAVLFAVVLIGLCLSVWATATADQSDALVSHRAVRLVSRMARRRQRVREPFDFVVHGEPGTENPKITVAVDTVSSPKNGAIPTKDGSNAVKAKIQKDLGNIVVALHFVKNKRLITEEKPLQKASSGLWYYKVLRGVVKPGKDVRVEYPDMPQGAVVWTDLQLHPPTDMSSTDLQLIRDAVAADPNGFPALTFKNLYDSTLPNIEGSVAGLAQRVQQYWTNTIMAPHSCFTNYQQHMLTAANMYHLTVLELEDLLSKRSVVATHPGPVQVAGHTYNTGDVITTDQLETLWTATTSQSVDAVAASKVYQSAWSLVKESGCTAQGVKLDTEDYGTTVGGAHGAHNRLFLTKASREALNARVLGRQIADPIIDGFITAIDDALKAQHQCLQLVLDDIVEAAALPPLKLKATVDFSESGALFAGKPEVSHMTYQPMSFLLVGMSDRGVNHGGPGNRAHQENAVDALFTLVHETAHYQQFVWGLAFGIHFLNDIVWFSPEAKVKFRNEFVSPGRAQCISDIFAGLVRAFNTATISQGYAQVRAKLYFLKIVHPDVAKILPQPPSLPDGGWTSYYTAEIPGNMPPATVVSAAWKYNNRGAATDLIDTFYGAYIPLRKALVAAPIGQAAPLYYNPPVSQYRGAGDTDSSHMQPTAHAIKQALPQQIPYRAGSTAITVAQNDPFWDLLISYEYDFQRYMYYSAEENNAYSVEREFEVLLRPLWGLNAVAQPWEMRRMKMLMARNRF